jgi:hypothetical protein
VSEPTPGPWRVETYGGNNLYICLEDYIVAQVGTSCRREADAHLIAAAPDLLAACHRANALLLQNSKIDAGLQAAIAKAEGLTEQK